MLEQDRLYFSKYAIDPEIDISFDNYEINEQVLQLSVLAR
jgi:hypothetical protein